MLYCVLSCGWIIINIIIISTLHLPGNSITTSHCVGILLSHSRRGVIKWPAYGTLRRSCLEAIWYI